MSEDDRAEREQAAIERLRQEKSRRHELVGFIVMTTNSVEDWARKIAVQVLNGRDRRLQPWEQLLSGRSVREAGKWLEITAAWSSPAPPWYDEAQQFIKAAENAGRRRNDLIHRETTLGTMVIEHDDPAKSWSGPGLTQSRPGNTDEPLTDQYEALAIEIEGLDRRGYQVWEKTHEWVQACMKGEA